VTASPGAPAGPFPRPRASPPDGSGRSRPSASRTGTSGAGVPLPPATGRLWTRNWPAQSITWPGIGPSGWPRCWPPGRPGVTASPRRS